MGLADQFKQIGQAIHAAGPEFEALEEVTTALFGGRMGFKLIRFFDDFNGNMEQATKNIGNFGNEAAQAYPMMDEFSDQMGSMSVVGKQLKLAFFRGFIGEQGMGAGLDLMAEIRRYADEISPKVKILGEDIRKALTVAFDIFSKPGGFKDALKGIGESIGRSIGDGIRASIKDALNPFSGLFGGGKTSMNSNNPLLKETMAQTNILERIYRDKSNAQFA